jgi:serine protease Do
MLQRGWFQKALLVVTGLLAVALFMNVYALTDNPQPVSTVVTLSKDRPITTLRDLNQAFEEVAKAVTPAVVTVSTESTTKVRGIDPFSGLFQDPFGQFFGGPSDPHHQQQAPEREFKQQGLGSGVIVSGDGYILTNNHVIAGAQDITVRTSDGRSMKAKVVGADPKTDIAVIKVNASDLPAIQRGNSDSLKVGEMVMAIGSPLSPQLAHTVTQGIVSAVGRSNVGLADYEDYIQTDAAINPGNSGGALVNLDGQLVGVNSAIMSQSGGFQGIGFAVPSNMAFRVMDALIKNGKVIRGWLGVSIQDVNDQIAKAMHLSSQKGALVGDVVAGSPAQKAGLKDGDIVTSVNGKDIENSTELRNEIASASPGTTVTLGLLRDGKTDDTPVTLGELPSSGAPGAVKEELADLLGFKVGPVTKDLTDQYGLSAKSSGVVVTDIDQNSEAYTSGLREGDLVLSVNRSKVTSVADFNQSVKEIKKGDDLLLQVDRANGGFFLAFTL